LCGRKLLLENIGVKTNKTEGAGIQAKNGTKTKIFQIELSPKPPEVGKAAEKRESSGRILKGGNSKKSVLGKEPYWGTSGSRGGNEETNFGLVPEENRGRRGF